ncbi:hypothetical protein MUA90_00535 [Staphylococcus sp. IVB6181]|nr:hypothetical protein MUA90_00535 [Staphylococcus sp. IVB6181]
MRRKGDMLEQYLTSESKVDLRDINFAWDQLITDEDELVEAGFPLTLLEKWIEEGSIVPFFPKGAKRHFYSKDVFIATVHHVLHS